MRVLSRSKKIAETGGGVEVILFGSAEEKHEIWKGGRRVLIIQVGDYVRHARYLYVTTYVTGPTATPHPCRDLRHRR